MFKQIQSLPGKQICVYLSPSLSNHKNNVISLDFMLHRRRLFSYPYKWSQERFPNVQ